MTAGALLATLFTVSTAAADSNVQKVIDETYVQPEYVLGYSLDEAKTADLADVGLQFIQRQQAT